MSDFFETGIKDIIFAYGVVESKAESLEVKSEVLEQQRDFWINYSKSLEKMLIQWKEISDMYNAAIMTELIGLDSNLIQAATEKYEKHFREYLVWKEDKDGIPGIS